MRQQIKLQSVCFQNKNLFFNMMDKYIYDLSGYEKTDVMNDGKFDISEFQKYLRSDKYKAFIIFFDCNPAGIVAYSRRFSGQGWIIDLTELFVMHRYRNKGISTYVISFLLSKLHGVWRVDFHPKNMVARIFWINFVDTYSDGKFKLLKNNKQRCYPDGTPSYTVIFQNIDANIKINTW